MTSLARYEFVLVPGPHGLNRVALQRTPKPAPRPNPDALPFRQDFAPALVAPSPPLMPPRIVPKAPVPRPPRTSTKVRGGVKFVCDVCGKTAFVRGHAAQAGRVHCSAACRQKAHILERAAQRQAAAAAQPARLCAACGEVLRPTPGRYAVPANKRFCGPTCADSRSRKRRQPSHAQ